MPNMEFLMGVTLLFKVTSIEYDPFKQCCDLEIEFSDARNQFNPFQIKAKVTQNEPLMIGKKHQTQLLSQPKSYLDTISRDQCTIQMGQKDQLILKNVSSKGYAPLAPPGPPPSARENALLPRPPGRCAPPHSASLPFFDPPRLLALTSYFL